MNKNILKNFAMESRAELMDQIEKKIESFYLNEEYQKESKGDLVILQNSKHAFNLSKEQYQNRLKLLERIKQISLERVIEEAAYTWFNRIIALRYMEIHDYLPLTEDNQSLGIRVLSDKGNTPNPEIMKLSNLTNAELDIEFDKKEFDTLNSEDEKFKYVLLLITKKLGKVIPQVFGGITDYIDLLIPDNLLAKSGFVNKTITEIPEDHFQEVGIIGKLYQYYNQAEKDRVMAAGEKYEKNEIAYVTQLFTPDWIAKYMVENSLGRYWLEHGGNIELKEKWKYYIDDDKLEIKEYVDPRTITFIDPCSGSGNILIYAFEVLFQIYQSVGFNKDNIPEQILENNLYGLDIDDRAGQLSILSVILKAREYDKDIWNKNIIQNLNIMAIQESNSINKKALDMLKIDGDDIESYLFNETIDYIYDNMQNAKEIGSLLKLDPNKKYEEVLYRINELEEKQTEIYDMEKMNIISVYFKTLVKLAIILTKKMKIMVTNPPYVDTANISSKVIEKYLKTKYKNTSKNLCIAFMECEFISKDTLVGIINQNIWMFKSTYANFRKDFVNNYCIYSLVHLGTKAFEELNGEKVDTVIVIMRKEQNNNKVAKYIRLDQYSTDEKEKELFNENNYFRKTMNDIKKNPQGTIAYWMSEQDIYINTLPPLSNKAKCCSGMQTGDNNQYIRLWYEINNKDKYWNWYMWGGSSWKWYGNYIAVINWKNDGKEIKENKSSVIRNPEYYFKKGITWKRLCSTNLKAVVLPENFIFDQTQDSLFVYDEKDYYHILGLLNSCVSNYLIKIVASGLSITSGSIEKIPYKNSSETEELVKNNIETAKADWDSFEISWDFVKHPLLMFHNEEDTISKAFKNWSNYCKQNFSKLKNNEEELNKIFINLYGLQKELTPEVDNKDITIRGADRVREIKSLISYAVGCMFGRYSLDEDGLVYAGGEFDTSKYKKFTIDIDNVIPITNNAYFKNDIVSRFVKFIEIVYGSKNLSENLHYIAETLGRKGTETSEETIRRYFINDFYKDHLKTYQKKPIYWLFESGKNNGFKCLIYMHRYDESTISTIRVNYLHMIQDSYQNLLNDVRDRLDIEENGTERRRLEKQHQDLILKLQEISKYDEKIAHLANKRIKIDLDDGVKANYEKFSEVLAKIK